MTGDFRLLREEAVASTSDLCIARARAGEPEGLAILAARQTQGRGSRGRDWESPSGNLNLSVLLRPAEAARTVAQWSLLAGVALVDALAHEGVTLKWPNDVLLDGRKLAGILLDTAADGAGNVDWLVIGLGANLTTAPAIPGRATIALAERATPPTPDDLAAKILFRLDHWRRIRMREGFAPIRAAWMERAIPVGAKIAIKVSDQTIAGEFSGLAEDGSLIVRTGGVTRIFATGEVLLPDVRPATGRG